jgi:hypothetical protein
MPTFAGTQQAAGPDLEDGSYEVIITEAQQEDGQYGPQVRVRFRVAKGQEGEGQEFNSWYSLYTNKTTGAIEPIRVGSKFGDLFSAALYGGEPFPEGAELDTDDLINKRVKVLWGEYRKKNGTIGTGVLSVKAAKKKPTAGAVAPPLNGGKSLRSRLVDDDDDSDLDDA